jgi:hypothetical protein
MADTPSKPTATRRRPRRSTGEVLARHILATHATVEEQHNDPMRPPETGRTAGEKHAARRRADAAPEQPPAA